MPVRCGMRVAAVLFCILLPASTSGEAAALEYRMFTGVVPSLYPNSVLIMGEREAVLVDGQWWLSEGEKLADFVEQAGRNLKAVLITHAHPDHYTGLNPVVERFPGVRVLARQAVQEQILYEYPAKLLHWQELVPGEMPERSIVPEVFTGDSIELEGREIRFVDLGPGETIHATAFYVPSTRTLIAGDLIFADSYSYVADLNNPAVWIQTLEDARDVGPIETIYPGHGPAGGPELIDWMIEYLEVYRDVARPGVRVAEIAREMMRRYPDLEGGILLWLTRGPGFGLSGAAELGVPPELFGGDAPADGAN